MCRHFWSIKTQHPMKRKVYTTANTGHTRKTGNFLTVSRKSGALKFTKELTDELKLKGKKVQFVQDEEKPSEWFIEITNDAHAFPVRISPTGAGVLQSVVICSELLKSAGLADDSSYRFLISTTPVEKTLYPIITKSGKPVIRVSK